MADIHDGAQQLESRITADDFYGDPKVLRAKMALSERRFEETMKTLEKLDQLDHMMRACDDIMNTLRTIQDDRIHRLERNSKPS